FTRAPWPGGYLGATQYHVWDLKPDSRSADELQELAELHSGARIGPDGTEVALTLAEYQERWQVARTRRPPWVAAKAPPKPAKRPVSPQVPAGERVKEKRPVQPPDYAALLVRVPDREGPPWLTAAEALADKDAGVRRAALETLVAAGADRPTVLALLVEAIK